MISLWKRALVAFAFAVCAPLSMAQVINVPGGNGSSVAPGASIKVSFSDPSRAGETIRITVSNNEEKPDYEEEVIEVTLDENGEGEATWVVVSTWYEAAFFGEGAAEVILDIVDARLAATTVGVARRR